MPLAKKTSKKIVKKQSASEAEITLDIPTAPIAKKACKRACKRTSAKQASAEKTEVKAKKSCKKATKKVARKCATSKPKVTRVIAKFDAGWGNGLTIRGVGGSLSWEKGIQLQGISEDEWLWEQFVDEDCVEFKILINDEVWSLGDDFKVQAGDTIVCRPTF